MSLRDRARDLLGSTDGDVARAVARRVDRLEQAVAACERHAEVAGLPAVQQARTVLDRAGQRLALSLDHTVVALAGATGSGKSSLFNALCRAEVAEPGVRRPTTTTTTAAVWPARASGAETGEGAAGDAYAGPLLDWLGASRRHQMAAGDHVELSGTVLLDLPDHDSTRRAHEQEVRRLTGLVDVFVWVVDPQKYADAALHEGQLAALRHQAERTVVVLNQVDRLRDGAGSEVLAHLRELLAARGMGDARVLAASATRGDGLEELAEEIAARVAHRAAARERLLADLLDAAEKVAGPAGVAGASDARDVPGPARAAVVDACAAAAGVPVVVGAVQVAARRRGRAATGWPLVSWIGRMRPDPLRRLHLEQVRTPGARAGSGPDSDVVSAARSSLPPPGPVEVAQLESSARELVEARFRGLPDHWKDAARRAARTEPAGLADDLDQAVVGVDLGVERPRVWMRCVRLAQWLLLLTGLVGAVWLLLNAFASFLVVPLPDVALGGRVGAVPLPTLLLVTGVLGGVLLAAGSRLLVAWSASRAARRADRALRAAVERVAERRILAPVAEVAEDQRIARAATG